MTIEYKDSKRIITSSDEYKIHKFTSTGTSTFAVTGSGDIEYLVVAGGGGGGVDTYSGGRGSGGGGAGGFRTNVSGATSGGGASAEATYNVTAQNYTITVGTGGAGGANTNGTGVIGSDGVNSSIVPASGTSIISTGGGGGGGHDNSANYSGRNGGSGGGAPNGTGSLTGTGVSGQGFAGGNPSDSSPYSGSGGGGSSSIGGASSGGNAGDGGAGTASSILGSSVIYAGGGGANGMTSSGSGGSGGGGAGGSGGAGTVNTGSGGGGDRQSTGGAGGSGIVIIRYLTSSGITATGGTITTVTEEQSKPTNVQDNSILVEKDTARRYWFDDSFNKTGCLIYYNFEQTSGDLTNQATTTNGFTDGLGSTGDGTSSGTVGKSNTGKVGNNAWSFGGGSVSSGSSSSLVLTGNASWVGWVKVSGVTSSAPADVIFSIRGGATNDNVDNALFSAFVIENTSPADLRYFHEYSTGSNQVYDYSSSDLTHGTWYHIAFVRDNSAKTVKLYVDGSLNGTYTYTNSPDTSATSRDLDLGGNGFDGTLDGMLDEVSLWNRVLTDAEITTLYNSGTGKTVDTAKGATWTMEPTWRDDFSSYSCQSSADAVWIPSTSSVTKVSITNDRLDWTSERQGNTDDNNYDLGSGAVDDEKWVLRFHWKMTTYTEGDGSGKFSAWGLFAENNLNWNTTGHDGIMMKMVFSSNAAENHYSIHESQNETLSAGNTTTFTETTSVNDDFYVEIKRTGSTTAEMSFYSDSNYLTLVENRTLTIDNVTGLRYLGVRTNGDASTVSGQAVGWIDDVEFYNGVTTVN